jgi:hypothetical protein
MGNREPAVVTANMPESLNFSFLAVHDPQLVRLATLAEAYFAILLLLNWGKN